MKVEKQVVNNGEEAGLPAIFDNSNSSLLSLNTEFSRMTERLFDSFWHEPAFLTQRNWRPTDMTEDADNVYLEVELPRFKKEEVKVEVKNRAVMVTAKNARSSFSRVFGISGVDYSKIEGKLEDGVLSVTLPKTQESKARQIELK